MTEHGDDLKSGVGEGVNLLGCGCGCMLMMIGFGVMFFLLAWAIRGFPNFWSC